MDTRKTYEQTHLVTEICTKMCQPFKGILLYYSPTRVNLVEIELAVKRMTNPEKLEFVDFFPHRNDLEKSTPHLTRAKLRSYLKEAP